MQLELIKSKKPSRNKQDLARNLAVFPWKILVGTPLALTIIIIIIIIILTTSDNIADNNNKTLMIILIILTALLTASAR